MKTKPLQLFLIIVISSLFISCSSSKLSGSLIQDGLSYETAVVVKSVSFEYKWIKENYPGSQVQMQALNVHKRKHYDVLTIITSHGETEKIYFDISNFFGKF